MNAEETLPIHEQLMKPECVHCIKEKTCNRITCNYFPTPEWVNSKFAELI
jgi:hypothetical protein